MMGPFGSIALAALCTCLGVLPTVAQPVCKPVLAIKHVTFSEMYNWKRSWTAAIDVDSSRCATSHGLFAIHLTRLSENAPDIGFVEPFIWRSGRNRVVVELWGDEAVGDYRIDDTASCPCRRD